MNGKTERREHDAYFTPPELARAIVERVATFIGEMGRIWEPHCGGGAFVAAARAQWPKHWITALDLVDRRDGALAAGACRFVKHDWLQPLPAKLEPYTQVDPPDLIIGNPPFLDAEAHVRRALEVVRPPEGPHGYYKEGGHVAFLLRLAFLASGERLRGISASGPSGMGLKMVCPIAPRPSFTGLGSDNSEYALFVWQRDFKGLATLGEPIFWKPAKKSHAKPVSVVKAEPAPERLAQFKDAEAKGQLSLLGRRTVAQQPTTDDPDLSHLFAEVAR